MRPPDNDVDQVLDDLQSGNPIPTNALAERLEGYEITRERISISQQQQLARDDFDEGSESPAEGRNDSFRPYSEPHVNRDFDGTDIESGDGDQWNGQQQQEKKEEDDSFKSQQTVQQMQRAQSPAPKRRRAYFTIGMIGINCLAFLLTMQQAGWQLQDRKLNPMIGPDGAVLTRMGARVTPMIVEDGEWWRLFTAMFLHAGVVHLVFNMYSFWGLGKPLEEEFGFKTVAFIYVVSGFTGNAASAIFLPVQITVGASGAIFGLFGAVWADFIQNCAQYKGQRTKTLCKLLLMSVVSLAIGLMPLVDNFAHVGGFIGGLLSGLSLVSVDSRAAAVKHRRGGEDAQDARRRRCTTECCWQKFIGTAGLFLLGCYILTECAILFSDEHTPEGWCSFCEKINCLDTPYWECNADNLSSCVGVGIFTDPGSTTVSMLCADGVTVEGIDGSQCMADPACFFDDSIACQWSNPDPSCACGTYCSFK
jgi:membrane associated rhomboid family serine protease